MVKVKVVLQEQFKARVQIQVRIKPIESGFQLYRAQDVQSTAVKVAPSWRKKFFADEYLQY
jgi:hypothetical protein